MSGGEMDGESIEERESKKMEAKSFLETLYFLDHGNGGNSLIPKMRKIIGEEDEEAMRDLLVENGKQIEKLLGLFGFLKNYKKADARARHDLNNIAAAVDGMLAFYLESANKREELNFDHLSVVVSQWGRYVVGVEDVLVRIISEDTIPQEYNNGLDIDTVWGAINYFYNSELSKIRSFKKDPNSAYKEIDKKTIDCVTLSNCDQLKLELGDDQIAGNNGLVGNFLLNALRNSLKDRVEANNIRLTAKIKGDWFVMRVEDDGKGIASKFLQKDYKEKDETTGEEKSTYIFCEGASGTGSSGIGLADFDTRLASVGGELYVVSKPKYVKEKDLVRFQYGSTAEKANEVEFDESLEHGTVFEIRLPIIKKDK